MIRALPRRNLRLVHFTGSSVVLLAVVFLSGGCPQAPIASRTFSADTTIDELIIAADELNLIRNDAVVTVTGDAVIDGTLQSSDGRLTLIVEGNLTVNGRLRATAAAPNDADQDRPFEEQPSGIFLLVSNGRLTFSEDSSVFSTGPIVITDDASVLEETPEDLYDEVEEVGDEDIATLAPLTPENNAFAAGPLKSRETGSPLRDSPPKSAKLPVLQQDQGPGPITISGEWPPAGSNLTPGDRPVIILRFTSARPLNLSDWTVNGPPAPAGMSRDQRLSPGEDAAGSDGRDGLRLNIRNDGGPINILGGVVLNLADGGQGGGARATCGGDATGGDGGVPGNFRMSATGGIDVSNGRLTINPGEGGDGGDAIVDSGADGADGCPGGNGSGGTSTGGDGADNRRRLLVRGNVTGLERLEFGPLAAGDGGDATYEACDGGSGDQCCDGGTGASATAVGGNGGDAALDLMGVPVSSALVSGGQGGEAEAIAGLGGAGGDCKLDDAGNGGDAGDAEATAGDGGTASNTGDGGAEGGDGGDASAIGGDGGNGGDSGFGTIGTGGDAGAAVARGGNGGAATTAGSDGDEDERDGDVGFDGVLLPTAVFCLRLTDFVDLIDAVVLPQRYDGPVTRFPSPAVIGQIDIEFLAIAGAEYDAVSQPVPNVGISGGTLVIDVDSLFLQVPQPGEFRGIRIEPLASEGIDAASPLGVRAIGQSGLVLDAVSVAELPDNTANPNDPLGVDVFFDTEATIAAIELIVPRDAFVALMRVYLLDP